MSTVERRHSPVQRQLEAYEESWMGDHRAAMACRDVEDTLAVGVAVFRLLRRVEDSWRERVFRGSEDFAEEDDRWVQGSFRGWLQVTEDVLNALPTLEQRFGSVDGADELRECAGQARALLEAWQPPRLSRAVGLREMTLSPEAVTELDRILAEAKENPPPTPTGPIPQEISADEFLARMQRRRP
jgi:hypothetical protein